MGKQRKHYVSVLLESKKKRKVVPQEETQNLPGHERWTGEMVIRLGARDGMISYGLSSRAAYRVEWISRELDEQGNPRKIRVPREKVTHYPTCLCFAAAGKLYRDWRQLVSQPEEKEYWYRDIYGRQVFALYERFPCFDSYDFNTENRYYRWFFLRENEKLTCVYWEDGAATLCVTEDAARMESHLTCVYWEDGAATLCVTEDAARMESHCWEIMTQQNYFA